MTTPLRLGIAGLGTVGTGVVRIVRQKADLLQLRTGRSITDQRGLGTHPRQGSRREPCGLRLGG